MIRLIIWDGTTDDDEAIVVDLEPGQRYLFSDPDYAVALGPADRDSFTDRTRFDTAEDQWAWPLDDRERASWRKRRRRR